MINQISPEHFFTLAQQHPIIDVRSPGEFAHGHVPNAHNIPLFSDSERAMVGTIYKQVGKQDAIHTGMALVGPRLINYVTQAQAIIPNNTALIYCARGGMRSKSFVTLLATYGINVYQLIGGFKAYKKYLRDHAQQPHCYVLIGGKTGSGKTHILCELEKRGEQIIDLESLANHKGSVFGGVGLMSQPTQEQFNLNCLAALAQLNRSKIIWLEKESYKIGNLTVPQQIWQQMINTPVVYLQVSHQQRSKNLMRDYGSTDPEILKKCVHQLTKKIGGQRTHQLCQWIDEKNSTAVIDALLAYYDQLYTFSLEQKNATAVTHITLEAEDHDAQAAELLSKYQEHRLYAAPRAITPQPWLAP